MFEFIRETCGAIRAQHVVIPAAVIALATPFLFKVEGVSLTSYRDPVGVWTNCVGDTQGAGPGQHFTLAQCAAKLQARLPDYYTPLAQCIPALPTFPPEVQAALLSFVYNEGPSTACHSSVERSANAGDLRSACNNLMNFQRAGNNPTMLYSRRLQEKTLCLQGVK